MNKYKIKFSKLKSTLLIFGMIGLACTFQINAQQKSPVLKEKNNATNNLTSSNVDLAFNPSLKSEVGKIEAILTLPDNKVIVGGNFTKYNGTNRNYLIRLNTNGSIDNAFTAETNLQVLAIARQSDGKILIAGSFTEVNGVAINRLARLNADGSLDNTFNVGSGANATINDIVIRPDGKILISGRFSQVNGVDRGAIAQVNSDGSLDTGFTPITNIFGIIFKLGLQADGKVIIGNDLGISGTNNFGLARLNNDGSLDETFRADLNDSNSGSFFIRSIIVLSDGKILVGGKFDDINSTPADNIARLNDDGSVDTTFTGSIDPSNSNAFVDTLKFQSDGKIVVGGFFTAPTNNIARLNSDGSVDATFNVGSGTNDSVEALDIDSNDKILIGGYFTNFNSNVRGRFAGLNSDGSLDSTFNVGTGFSLLRIGRVNATISQPDGKILAVGDFTQVNGVNKQNIVRLNSDGSVDNTFDSGVGVFITRTNVFSRILTIALQSDGKILIGGSFNNYNGNSVLDIARLNTDGTLDTSFLGNAIPTVNKIVVQDDDKILLGGDFINVNGQFNPGIARLNADGSLDTSFNVAFNQNSRVNDIVVQPDGKIIFTGGFQYIDPKTNNIVRSFTRVNSDGSFDTSFTRGVDSLNIAVRTIKLLPDGKILIGGSRGVPAVARLNTDGSVDTSFSNILSGNGAINDMHIQGDGKTIVVGTFTVFQGVLLRYIARVNIDGSLDTTWKTEADDRLESIMPYGDDQVIVGGFFSSIGGFERTNIALLSTDSNGATKFDFDGDGKSDLSIFRPGPNPAQWWLLRSSDGGNNAYSFGLGSDRPTPADYTGDGKTDIAFFRESTSEWFVLRSEDFTFFSFPFGAAGDIPAPGDFDGDGVADQAVYRPSNGTWFINQSSGGTRIEGFGISEDQPVVGDYDGDGMDDLAIYRPSNSQWWLNRSTDGVIVFQFGTNGDQTVQGDYTGDGKDDVAFFRPSSNEWFVLRSKDATFFSFPFGAAGDIPAPGDYDGDGQQDAAVFRPSTTTWFLQGSTSGTQIVGFGLSSDIPLANSYVYE